MRTALPSRLPRALASQFIVVLLLISAITSTTLAAASPAGTRAPSVQTRIGMWYQPGAPERERLWHPGDPGTPLFLRGRIVDVGGQAVGGAQVEIWHADPDGFADTGKFRTRLRTDGKGVFRLATVLPGYIFGPRHIHFLISHAEHARLVTRVFFRRDPVIKLHDYEAVLVALEDGVVQDQPALFGSVEFVLPPN